MPKSVDTLLLRLSITSRPKRTLTIVIVVPTKTTIGTMAVVLTTSAFGEVVIQIKPLLVSDSLLLRYLPSALELLDQSLFLLVFPKRQRLLSLKAYRSPSWVRDLVKACRNRLLDPDPRTTGGKLLAMAVVLRKDAEMIMVRVTRGALPRIRS